MRSESEIRWVRVKNNVGQMTKVSKWHAIIPGLGADGTPPGTACGTRLMGSFAFEQHSAIKSRDGQRHADCERMADEYVAGIDPSPGPREPDEEWITFKAPGSSNEPDRTEPRVEAPAVVRSDDGSPPEDEDRPAVPGVGPDGPGDEGSHETSDEAPVLAEAEAEEAAGTGDSPVPELPVEREGPDVAPGPTRVIRARRKKAPEAG